MTYSEILLLLFLSFVLPVALIYIASVIHINFTHRNKTFRPSRDALMVEIKQLNYEIHQLKIQNSILLNENRRLRHEIQRERSAPRERSTRGRD